MQLLLFSCPVLSDSLQPRGLQHTRFPYPSLFPRVHSNSYPLSHPLLLPSIFPSIRVFTNESALRIRWPEYWSFSVSPSNEYSGLISFRMDWFDLLAVRGTVKSFLQNLFESIDSSVLTLLYGSTLTSIHDYWKTTALNIRSFVGKVMSLLFNMLSRFVITFLPRSKHLLISWLQSPSAVIFEPPNIKSTTVSPSICHEGMGPRMPWS